MTDFQWPWEYSFPPFFTLQPHEETRRHQIDVWANLFLKYLKHIDKYSININESDIELYRNEKINRSLSTSMVLTIVEHLEKTGHAEALDKKRTEWLIYFSTVDEYANMIYSWIQETGQVNTVCTLYEIAQGENSEGLAFHGLDERVLLNALKYLENLEKCEIIDMDGSYGVKFF